MDLKPLALVYQHTSYFISAPVRRQQDEVAFFVRKQNSQSTVATTVTFETVITAQGGTWNSVFHSFIIPTKGMYFLHHTLSANGNGWVITDIRRDTTDLQQAQANVAHSTGSASVVFELDALAQVSCYVSGGDAGVRGDGYTHFNGFLIYTM